MNDLLDAANSSEDNSSERYEKLKKEEAGTDADMAKKRYEELKEEAKQEYIEKQKKRERENEEEEEKDEDPGFVTY